MGLTAVKKRIIHLISWTTVVLLIIAGIIGILRLGVEYSGEILYRLVQKETNGYYQLAYDELNIDLWKRTIELKKVVLKPDQERTPNVEGLNNLYDLEIEGLNIQLKSILAIYLDRQLLMRNMRIIDPEIHIARKDNVPDESFSLQTGNLYKEISDYLRVLQIDFLAIDNASFKHSPSEFSLGNIDFLLKNLLIDSASRPNESFYSESIELEINDQSFMLGDSIHQVSFDRLLVSTADSVFTFDNLILSPVVDGNMDAPNNENVRTVFNISIPRLSLIGVDYFSAYRFNNLEMNELSISDSQVFLNEIMKGTTQSGREKNSLINQLFSVFDEVKIGKVRFINTKLDLKTDHDYSNNYQHVVSDRADLVFYNFKLDSSNYQIDYGKKYFDDVDIIIHDYSSFLPDSIHTIDFELLRLSSFDSSLVFENFKIANHSQERTSDMYLTVDLPLLRIRGLDYPEALTGKQLIIREVQVTRPTVAIDKQLSMGQQTFSPDSLYSLFSDQFQAISIKKLILEQGGISINDLFQVDQIDLRVTEFKIPQDTNSWYHGLGDLSLNMSEVGLTKNDIQATSSNVKWDSLSSSIMLDEVNLDYEDQHTKLSGAVSNISVSGMDLDSIFKGNYLAFDTMRVIKPEIIFESLNSTKTLDISGRNRFIEIVDGKFDGTGTHGKGLSIEKINTKLMLGTDNYVHQSVIDNLSINLPYLSNKLYISKINLDQDQKLLIQNIDLLQTKDSLHRSVELSATVPSLVLYGLDQELLWLHQKISGDSLGIKRPKLLVNLLLDKDLRNRNDSIEFEFGKVIIDGAALKFADKRQQASRVISSPALAATLTDFQYPQKAALDEESLFFSKDVTLTTTDIQSIEVNGDSILLESFFLDSKEGLLLTEGLKYSASDGSTSAHFDQARLRGVNLNALVNNKHLILDSLKLNEAQFSHDPNLLAIDQRSLKESVLQSINISWFSSTGTEIEIIGTAESGNYSLHRGNIEVVDYSTQGKITWTQLFGDAANVNLTGENLNLQLKDGYLLSIEEYTLDHPGNLVNLGQVAISSSLSKSEYSKKLSFQKDWYDASANEISFHGLDLDRLLSKNEFQAQKVLVEGFSGLSYRDKHLPFDTTQTRPLPQKLLLNIDKWITIDTLSVKGNITHQIRPENTEDIAEIDFNSVTAMLLNLTTVDSMTDSPMRLVADGLLMNEAPFRISALFDMQDPNDRFSFDGEINDLQLGALNRLLRPLANINIRDGYGERINFKIRADNDVATGEMRFRYDDLKIQILNPDAGDKNANQGLKTFFANTFVINHKNPGFIVLKPGTIFHERDPARVIFHYWGEALLSGAVSSIGINKSKKEEKRYEKVK